MKNLNDKILEKLTNILNLPILIYFWSEWCEICKISKNIISDIEIKFKNKIKIIKINIDYNYYTIEKFAIKNIPTIIIILNKKIIIKKQGLFDREFFKKLIKKIL
ncbi:thioredoxin domain-containing protein [Candidatus Nasuia deltocephalinicola]|uniref:thioredoxin domain-containing protein n=1 Tax=Candidatus Nasuia deltocephalincola TaxID=1160784 RepID=UPI00216B24D9|nr:thioredoxin domain-containing protein [Candidatus Nasuia deltocephalinicola]